MLWRLVVVTLSLTTPTGLDDAMVGVNKPTHSPGHLRAAGSLAYSRPAKVSARFATSSCFFCASFLVRSFSFGWSLVDKVQVYWLLLHRV